MAAAKLLAAAGAAASIISVDISATIERLQGEQRKASEVGDQIIATVETENRDFTDSEKKELRDAQSKVETISTRLELYKKQLELRAKAEAPGKSVTIEDRSLGGKPGGGGVAQEQADQRSKDYAVAFDAWMRRGVTGLSNEQREILHSGFHNDEELRDLSAGTGSAGGYAIPQGFIANIATALKQYGGMRLAPTYKMPSGTGNDMPMPTVNDTSNTGELLAENTAAASQDVTFGQVTLKAYLYSSKMIPVSNVLLQDQNVGLEGYLAKILGERLGRITNTHFTTGDNSSKPQGIVTGATAGVTAASATAITFDELIDLQHSVDPAYRASAARGFMFNDTTFKLLRKLKDSEGRPIWQSQTAASMAEGPAGTLLGDPYWINQDMAGPTTGNKSIIYGDLSQYYIRDVLDIVLVRMSERYAEKFQTAFVAFMRCDGRIVNAGTNPIKYLIQA